MDLASVGAPAIAALIVVTQMPTAAVGGKGGIVGLHLPGRVGIISTAPLRAIDSAHRFPLLDGKKSIVVDLVNSWCDACTRELTRDAGNPRLRRSDVDFVVVDEGESTRIARKLQLRFSLRGFVCVDLPDRSLTNSGSDSARRRFLFYGVGGPLGSFAESLGVTELPVQVIIKPFGAIERIEPHSLF